MPASLAQVLWHVQRWHPCGDAPDRLLLERFIGQRDEAAFAALVARYSAMVLRQCRRVLGDVHAAEDAFQTVFLILARKAGSIRQPEALPGWLHGVARRVALKARTRTTARPSSETLPDDALPDLRPDPLTQLSARELLDILDEEVQRLPANQRSPVVLCCLQGRTQEEAARILDCSQGAIKGRLERGRRYLQQRLKRRGIALSAALAVAGISHAAAAPPILQRSAVRAALGGASGPAQALAEGVLHGMGLGKLAAATAMLLSVVMVISTAAALTYRGAVTEMGEDQTPAVPLTAKETDAAKPEARTDALGDPLPAGAIARLGTLRLRHGGSIVLLRFTPDGKRLVAQGNDGVRVWDPTTGKELRHIAPRKGSIWGHSDLSPDGKHVAVSGHVPAGPIELWDVESGEKVGSLGEQFYLPVCYSPDGKFLATSSTLPRVDIWDLASRKKLRSWDAHSMQVWYVAFSSDSRKLLTAGTEHKLRLWDVETGRQLQEFTPLDWKQNVIGTPPPAVLSPDGKLLALNELTERPQAGSKEWKARITLRDVQTGKTVRQITCPSPEVAPNFARCFSALTFTADGKQIITGGPDDFLRFWDPATGQEQRRLPLHPGLPSALTLSPDGRTLAAVLLGGTAIRLVDLSTGKTLVLSSGHQMRVSATALTRDGRAAVTTGYDEALLIWDVQSGRTRRRLEGHTGPIHSLWLGGDGRTLYSAGWDRTLRVWDLVTGQERRRFSVDLPQSGMARLTPSADGKSIALVDASQTICIVDVTSGTKRQLHRGTEWVLGLAFAADGRWLVGWSGDRMIRVWDVATGRQLREQSLPPVRNDGPAPLGVQNPSLYSAALSPDGRLLAVGSQQTYRQDVKPEHYLLFLDMASGREVRRLDNLAEDPYTIAFSPDGRVLAFSGLHDPTIRLLEVSCGRERRRLIGHRGPVSSLAFTPDGRRLISGSDDTTALVWDLRDDPGTPLVTAGELDALWADLADQDAVRAYRAIRKLAAAPALSVPLLRQRVRPAPVVDEKRLTGLIADLDSDDFAIRQKAVAELEKLGDQPLAAYRKVLEGKPSVETRCRIEELMEKAGPVWWDVSGERLRSLRAVEALELAGTKEARDLLKALADGGPGARLTEQAKAALERLARQERP
jgi:RNA polymerase sigma factor (sigma-70 family)